MIKNTKKKIKFWRIKSMHDETHSQIPPKKSIHKPFQENKYIFS